MSEDEKKDLVLVELGEYVDLVDRLTKQPDFIAFIAKWVVDSGSLPVAPVNEESLAVTNYQIGRVSLLSEFMDSLKLVHNAAYLHIQGEVNKYEQRRIRADERSEREGGGGDDSDDIVYED